MSEGWIKLHRQLLESEVFASEKALKIWVWILLKANFKNRFVPLRIGAGQSVVEIGRGQLLFGRFSAEDELGINGSTIYKWIKKMEQSKMITIKSNSHYTIITVCKYDDYNQEEDTEVTTIEQPSNNTVTTEEQHGNTPKKEKNVKKEKNNNKFNFKKSLLDLGINEQIVSDWLKVRSKKNAANTKTAFDGILREINKTRLSANECIKIAVERNWQGFKSEWVSSGNNNTNTKSINSIWD
jgi:hypothetical protein